MNKKSNRLNKLLVVLFLVFILTGCTTPLKDSKKKTINNPNTGQTITDNVLCKPTDEAILKIYEKNKKDISKLPDCKDFKIAGEYEGLWENIFVRPLAYAIIKVGNILNSTGWAIIAIAFFIRLALYPVTKKTAMQSENIKKAKPELDKIEKKYKDKTDEASMQKKSQEIFATYKNFGVNPFSSCLFAIIQMPLLFAFIEAINRVPAIFEEQFLIFQMGTTPWHGITHGNYQYLILLALVIITTFLSFKMNKATANDDMANQMKMMMPILVVIIGITSFTLPAATGIYWITSSTFTILQNMITDRSDKNGKTNI